jgi:hypothetical protein
MEAICEFDASATLFMWDKKISIVKMVLRGCEVLGACLVAVGKIEFSTCAGNQTHILHSFSL